MNEARGPKRSRRGWQLMFGGCVLGVLFGVRAWLDNQPVAPTPQTVVEIPRVTSGSINAMAPVASEQALVVPTVSTEEGTPRDGGFSVAGDEDSLPDAGNVVPLGPAPALKPVLTGARYDALARAKRRVTAVGLCNEEEVLAREKARQALLQDFVRVETPLGPIITDPVLPEAARNQVASELVNAAQASTQLFRNSPSIAPVAVIVYRSLDQMRSVSCVNKSAFGYYDGSIHLSGNPNGGLSELSQTLRHEYTHHVMLQSGVRLPLWLTEGAAMVNAEETWWRQPSLGLVDWAKGGHLPFIELVTAFSHASDERSATHTYFQSYLMVQFLRSRSPGSLDRVIEALGSGKISPDEAFEWGAQLDQGELEAAWRAFVQSIY